MRLCPQSPSVHCAHKPRIYWVLHPLDISNLLDYTPVGCRPYKPRLYDTLPDSVSSRSLAESGSPSYTGEDNLDTLITVRPSGKTGECNNITSALANR